MSRYQVELTDTIGGEANYDWVRRVYVKVPPNSSERTIVARAKAALGLTGVKCKRKGCGDIITLYPQGSCTVAFIMYQE